VVWRAVVGSRVGAAGVAGLFLAALLPAAAAPLDGLLTAMPERTAPRGYLELGSDHLNGSLEFLRSSEDDPQVASPVSGDYRGVHLAGAFRATDGLWISGSLWRRDISSDADDYRYRSWQLSGQYRFNEPAGAMPAVALRVSGWGNSAKSTVTTTPLRVQDAILDTVTVTAPSDRQFQLDLIGTWALTPALDISATLGVGSTELEYERLNATTRRNGCSYDLEFNGNDIFGNLAGPCTSTSGVIRQFYDSSGDHGVDVANEIAWSGRFYQAGINAAWRTGAWTLLGGYLFHEVRREAVDDILTARGHPVYRRNETFTLETAYQFHANLGAFVRAQVSSNLFFSDIPVTYNTSTSDSFGNRYSVFTLGLRASF
jgi:hypothetical protein